MKWYSKLPMKPIDEEEYFNGVYLHDCLKSGYFRNIIGLIGKQDTNRQSNV